MEVKTKMKDMPFVLTPGTAGVTQRISSQEESRKELSVLKYNKLQPCGHNQY